MKRNTIVEENEDFDEFKEDIEASEIVNKKSKKSRFYALCLQIKSTPKYK